MKKMNFLAASIIAASLAVTGCANKQQTGTMIGAGIGGVACGYLAKNTSSATQMIIALGCAAAGGYAGNLIGKSLDERDQVTLAATTQKALNSGTAGTYNWNSEHSGASAQVTVGEAFQKTEQVQVKRTAMVQPVAQMEKLSGQYLTLKGANVRTGPSTNSDKVGYLQGMTEFSALGKTGDWIMVGRKGVAVGYIYAPLVQSKASYQAALAKKSAPVVAAQPAANKPLEVAKAVPVPEVKPAVVLDEATAATSPDLGKLAVDAPVIETGVAQVETCRSIESSVKDAKGSVTKETASACKKADEDIWADA